MHILADALLHAFRKAIWLTPPCIQFHRTWGERILVLLLSYVALLTETRLRELGFWVSLVLGQFAKVVFSLGVCGDNTFLARLRFFFIICSWPFRFLPFARPSD